MDACIELSNQNARLGIRTMTGKKVACFLSKYRHQEACFLFKLHIKGIPKGCIP